MGKHTSAALIALTCIWVIFSEDLSWRGIAIGMFAAMVCTHFTSKFLPFKEIENVDFYKLITYPLFLVGQIYLAAISMIKLILTQADADIITVKTEIENEALRIIFVDSITLTPGSILLDLDGQMVTALCIREKNDPLTQAEAEALVKGKIEARLQKALRP